jgi:hypothetical protein
LLTIDVAIRWHSNEASLKVIREDLDDRNALGLHLLAKEITEKRLVLFVDQFEELFTPMTDEREPEQFTNLLVTAATEPDGQTLILLTLRADFYDRPMHYPELGRLLEIQGKAVLPLSLADLYDVVQKPAQLPDVQIDFEEMNQKHHTVNFNGLVLQYRREQKAHIRRAFLHSLGRGLCLQHHFDTFILLAVENLVAARCIV